jgi:hypothetical protein
MTIIELKAIAVQMIADFPHLEDDVTSYFHLAQDEIEQGGSEYHECELAYWDIMNLLNEENED